MKKYVLSAAAELDLEAIWEYIAEDNIDAADQWIGKLFAAFETIEQTPGIGHTREDLTSFPVRFWPVGAYLVLYRVLNKRGDCGRNPGSQGYPCIPSPAYPVAQGTEC